MTIEQELLGRLEAMEGAVNEIRQMIREIADARGRRIVDNCRLRSELPIAYSAAHAAAAIGISVDRLYELAKKGECQAARQIGGRWVFSTACCASGSTAGPRCSRVHRRGRRSSARTESLTT